MPGAPDDAIVESQKRFYDLRAADYLTGAPSDRPGMSCDTAGAHAMARAVVDELRPTGTVLELGCGPGAFTRELARHATTVTALDSSPRMLARNQSEVAAANVTYVSADVFRWSPDRTYDVVFFGFLLSHVPPQKFEAFWEMVSACVGAHGRVAFVDEDDRIAHYDHLRSVDGVPVARRTLRDGQEFDIVKVFWNPNELASRLADLGWNISIRRVGDGQLYGVGARISMAEHEGAIDA